jgi:hypothetical protein
MTVFIVPPFNVTLEVCQEFIWTEEFIVRLFPTPVPVISFPSFVVITEYANLVDYIGQAVLIGVIRSRQWFAQTPKDNLRESILGKNYLVSE